MKAFKTLLFIVLSVSLVFAETADAAPEEPQVKTTKDGDFTLEDGVYVLNQDNFASALEKFEYVLVEFYAPWCGHCQRLAPEYAAAAQQLAETGSTIKLAKVDATENNDLGDKYEVQGYPTLKWFTKGAEAPVDYTGGRVTSDILSWVNRRSGKVSSEVKSLEEVENYINSSDAVALFIGTSSSSNYNDFVKAVFEYDTVVVINSNEDAVKEKYGGQENGLIIFNSHGKEKHVFEGTAGVDSFREFIDANQYPAVTEFNQAAVGRIFQAGRDAIFLLKAKNDAGEKAEATFRNIAKDVKSEIILSVANFDEDLGGRLAEFLGVTEADLPTIRIVQPSNGMKKYRPEGEISEESLKKFVSDVKAGNLKPFLKSADIPAEPLEGNVTVIVSKTWESIVLDSTKDVLVELYAPWCGHCQALAPVWDSLAGNLKQYENVVIAKMDATANEVEGVDIEGFPTIKLYKKDDKQNPIDFDRNREEKDFIRFLKKHDVIPKDGTEEPSDVLASGEFDWPGDWNAEGDLPTGDDHDHAGHDHHGHDHGHDHSHHDHTHEEKKKADDEL